MRKILFLTFFTFYACISIKKIHGSSLDSMAKAVENSKCILMCVTEKYRQSLNCQVIKHKYFTIYK